MTTAHNTTGGTTAADAKDAESADLLYIIEWLHGNGLSRTESALMEEIQRHPKFRGVIQSGGIGSPTVVESPKAPSQDATPPSGKKPRERDHPARERVPSSEPAGVSVVGVEEEPVVDAVALSQQLRQLVEEMTTGVGARPPAPVRSPLLAPLPALPPGATDTTEVETWSGDDDLGFTTVLCANTAEEARELWACDEEGALVETPNFPFGAGLSPAQVMRFRCAPGLLPGEVEVPPTPNNSLMSTSTGSFNDGTTAVTPGAPPVPAPPAARPPHQPAQLEVFDLKVIYEVGRTGFEENKDFPIVINSLIANRYQVMEYIGSAAFSRAVQCLDLKTGQTVCIKIIRNSKDFFDQSLDEIKLLQYLNTAGDSDEHCVLQLYDYFYYKEHLFLVCELLKDNLYEFAKYNREHPEEEFYFTMARMQKITRSILQALNFIHKLQLMHCDLKPENILIKSYSRCEIKVIDFGSSCFVTDHLSSYVQSRCYRAPEVILGMPYDQRIDIWSLGAILPELLTGKVVFHNESVPQMLARIASICGPYSTRMLQSARHAHKYFTRSGVVYERKEDRQVVYLYAKPTELRHRVGTSDELFADFVTRCLTLDPATRPTAAELLQHPFLLHDYGSSASAST